MSRVQIEVGGRTFLAWCRDCPSFRALHLHRADALRAAANHLDACHETPQETAHVRERIRRITDRDTPT